MCRPASVLIGIVAACALTITGCQSWGFKGGEVSPRTHTALAEVEPIPLADAAEVDLVEEMARHRQSYEQYLRALVSYYNETGYRHKAVWAEKELKDLRTVKKYRYLVDAEIPGPSLEPRDSIAEADALYDDGKYYMKQGGHGVPVLYDAKKMKLALEKFNEVIRKHPTSDKIDDAAFYAGEIYKEYFNDDHRALAYYQRAWEWDPQTPHPARFQAAVVSDFRLHDRDRALELYHQVLEHETFDRSNVRFSVRRIQQLTEDHDVPTPREADLPAEPPVESPTAATAAYDASG